MTSRKSVLGRGFPSQCNSAAKAMLRPSMANLLAGSRCPNINSGYMIIFSAGVGVDTFYIFLD